MKYVQKLVLVPIEKWEKIGDKDPVKQVIVKAVHQKSPTVHRKNTILPVEKVKNQKGSGKMKSLKTSQMFHFLSPKKRIKANNLAYYLEKDDSVKWNDDGELIYNGKFIPDSNIIQLINHALNNNKSKPEGMSTFYKILSKNNVPMKLISNNIGKQIMKKSLVKNKSSWRPPGRLNKPV